MTALLAIATVAALLGAVVLVVRGHEPPGPSRTFDTAAEEPERAPATYVALGRIQALMRALPDEDAAREVADLAGGDEHLREALR